MWALLHDEQAMVERWRVAEEAGYTLEDGLCMACCARHLPIESGEECPNEEDRRETEAEYGRGLVRQARLLIADARKYKERATRPDWAPSYDGLIESVLAVEGEVERAQAYAEIEERRRKRALVETEG